jgi:hypothetical protein
VLISNLCSCLGGAVKDQAAMFNRAMEWAEEVIEATGQEMLM